MLELVVDHFVCTIADMGMRLLRRTQREGGEILYSIRFGRYLAFDFRHLQDEGERLNILVKPSIFMDTSTLLSIEVELNGCAFALS